MRMAMVSLLALLVIGCGAPAVTSALPSDTPSRATLGPTPMPAVVDGALLWALDRGPELTPDQATLRVYLFGVGDLRGTVTLLGPDGSAVAEVGIMGSGIYGAESCMARVSSKANGITAIGAVPWSEAAQAAFLADPVGYRADVDLGSIRPGAGRVIARLADSGCRPL